MKELQAACEQLQDSVRVEAAHKADLQAELYDVRTTYAKAVGTREALEARSARAEAEKAAAEASLATIRGQVCANASVLLHLNSASARSLFSLWDVHTPCAYANHQPAWCCVLSALFCNSTRAGACPSVPGLCGCGTCMRAAAGGADTHTAGASYGAAAVKAGGC